MSSNPVNQGFYHLLGFETAATFYLGTDNPTWRAPPIPIDIVSLRNVSCGPYNSGLTVSLQMVREPRGVSSNVNEKAIGLELL